MNKHKRGFTLIELLVVVIIIAVLAAIAVPMYKHAVLKSRFSTVMPMAKAVADAQEVYYLGRGYYAQEDEKDVLDVTPVHAENTSVVLSQTDGYDYVMAENSKVPGAHYIVYQKHSENYPSEIHCEAQDENDDAQWLCSSLSQNNSIGKTLTEGYTTYLISGTGVGIAPGANSEGVASCDKALAMGYSCTLSEDGKTKKICKGDVCRTYTYGENGGYTSVTCRTDSDGVCNSYYDWYSATYDENGNLVSTRGCSTIAEDGTCSVYRPGYTVSDDYTYDENGNRTSIRICRSVATDGTCEYYGDGIAYTYDANGNRTAELHCTNFASDGKTCLTYDSGTVYTYDTDGKQTSSRECEQYGANGSCEQYGMMENYDYVYDGNVKSQRSCRSIASDGTCETYDYVYDYKDVGNGVVERRSCYGDDLVAADGTCKRYSWGIDQTYDTNGTLTSQRWCASMKADGHSCAEYSNAEVYVRDEHGTAVGRYDCSADAGTLNPNTGECINMQDLSYMTSAFYQFGPA